MTYKPTRPAGDWWREFFDTFRPLFDLATPKHTNAQVRFLVRHLGLKPGQRFLDCPCGIGRLSLPLARKGIKVTGVDITRSYLNELDSKVARCKLPVTTIHGDMRKVAFDKEFHAAANMWTSIGYFKRDADDLRVFKNMFRALKPGGRFLLHTINRDWIIANFLPSDWSRVGDVRILQERTFDYATSREYDSWTFLKDGKETVHETEIRMYAFHELAAMFRKVGFVDIEGYGSVTEDPVDRNNRMIFILGTRPKK